MHGVNPCQTLSGTLRIEAPYIDAEGVGLGGVKPHPQPIRDSGERRELHSGVWGELQPPTILVQFVGERTTLVALNI